MKTKVTIHFMNGDMEEITTEEIVHMSEQNLEIYFDDGLIYYPMRNIKSVTMTDLEEDDG